MDRIRRSKWAWLPVFVLLSLSSLSTDAFARERGGGWSMIKAFFRSIRLGSDPAKAFRKCEKNRPDFSDSQQDFLNVQNQILDLFTEMHEQGNEQAIESFLSPAIQNQEFREALRDELLSSGLDSVAEWVGESGVLALLIQEDEQAFNALYRTVARFDFTHGWDGGLVESQSRGLGETWRRFQELMASLGSNHPQDASRDLVELIESIGILPKKDILIGAIEVMNRLTVRVAPDQFAGINASIIQHYAELLASDPKLLNQCYTFHNALRNLDREQEHSREPGPRLGETTQKDVWELAQSATGGNVLNSLRCIGVFGHDVIARYLENFEKPAHPFVQGLNMVMPGPDSVLYYPNSLPGLKVSRKTLRRFVRFYERFERWRRVEPDLDWNSVQDGFRAGYYHAIGGVIVATEMIQSGFGHYFGFNLPVLLSELSGLFYKRMSMPNYMNGDHGLLYQLGYPKKRVERPENWSEARFERAKLLVEMNLAHVELAAEQHRRGAQWAYQKLKRWVKTRAFRKSCR